MEVEVEQAIAMAYRLPVAALRQNRCTKGDALPANTFKTELFVLALVSVGMTAHSEAAPADASGTYRTSCRGNDCVRYLCDNMGQDCFLLGYFDRREEIRPDRPEYGMVPDAHGAALPRYDTEETNDSGPHYHYKNHFDPDNDYDDPLG